MAGNFDTRLTKDESMEQKDVYNLSGHLNTIDARKEFVRNFVNDLIKEYPEHKNINFVFSGFSDYTIQTASMFEGTTLSMVDDYLKYRNRFANHTKNMVAVHILIRDTTAEAKAALNGYAEREREKDYTIYGTAQEVANQLLSLSNHGITDILLSVFNNDPLSSYTLHKLIHTINSEKEEKNESRFS